MTFVAEDAIWAEADVFTHDPADDRFRQPPQGKPRELSYVHEGTFWNTF